MPPMITYRTDVRPEAKAIADLYRAAPLNRPVDDLPRIARMFEGSNVVVTAWSGDRLAGILRGWTDGAFDGYICDLAIHPDFQKQGLGAKLLDLAREGKPEVQWVLLASRIAAEYYSHIGWTKIENGWKSPRSK
ncbi:MAG: GNAT family N-acetyltransferase [Planctomycetota bacterium]|nr:GNAT family N-acetyltransferase [Planctomycetota bacterium]